MPNSRIQYNAGSERQRQIVVIKVIVIADMFDLFSPHPGLSSEERQNATRTFTTVIEACEPLQDNKPYKQITLVRLTYEHARSEASRDNFLHFFFEHTQIPVNALQSESSSNIDHCPRLISFAETLMENFFLPCKVI